DRARLLSLFAMPHEHTDHLVPSFFQQPGGDARINSAGHCEDDAGHGCRERPLWRSAEMGQESGVRSEIFHSRYGILVVGQWARFLMALKRSCFEFSLAAEIASYLLKAGCGFILAHWRS